MAYSAGMCACEKGGQWQKALKLGFPCSRFVDDIPALIAATNASLPYNPREWHSFYGHYIPELRHIMAQLWKAAFKIRGTALLLLLLLVMQGTMRSNLTDMWPPAETFCIWICSITL